MDSFAESKEHFLKTYERKNRNKKEDYIGIAEHKLDACAVGGRIG